MSNGGVTNTSRPWNPSTHRWISLTVLRESFGLRFRTAVLTGLFAYAPWHDAISLGQRKPLFESGALSSLTTSGVANIAWIVLLSLALGLKIVPSYLKRNPAKIEYLLMLWPTLNLFHIPSLDSSALVMIGNSILHFFLISALIRRDLFKNEIQTLKRCALPVFFGSYILALLIPAIIPITNYDLFQYANPIYRYRGWTGEGQPIGFGGFALIVLTLLSALSKKKFSAIDYVMIFVGFIGISIHVLRISMLGSSAAMIAASIMLIRSNNSMKLSAITAALGGLFFFVLFTGDFDLKSKGNNPYEEPDRISFSKLLSPEYRARLVSSAMLGAMKEDIRALDKVVITNSRIGNIHTLIRFTNENGGNKKLRWLIGNGTGATQRIIKIFGADPFSKELGCDYFRILIDHGILGLFLVLFLFKSLFKKYQMTTAFPAFIALSVFMLTDIIMIIPTFGYVPILLGVLIFYRAFNPNIAAVANSPDNASESF